MTTVIYSPHVFQNDVSFFSGTKKLGRIYGLNSGNYQWSGYFHVLAENDKWLFFFSKLFYFYTILPNLNKTLEITITENTINTEKLLAHNILVMYRLSADIIIINNNNFTIVKQQ